VQTIALNDATLARFVKKCRELPGNMLFQYLDESGKRRCVDSVEVNAYLREITGRPFTAKNFRTWSGSVLVAQALCDVPPATSDAEFKRNTVTAVDLARERLGNTRAVCRKCYVHPAVFDAYRAGVTIADVRPGPRRPHFSAQEAAVLALLKRRVERGRREKVAA
jgi:DNA topoisomerase-1